MDPAADSLPLHRNLVNANHVFFVSPLHTHKKEKYDAIMRQSAGRALRLMQTRKVHIYMCVVLNTIDVDILEMRTSSRLLQRSGPVNADAESAITTTRPHHPDESGDEETQDAYGAPTTSQGSKRKRSVAEIDDTDNASAKRSKNAGLSSRSTEETDAYMDDDDAALARQLQADHDAQATDEAIARQIQHDEYQGAAGEPSGNGNAQGSTTEYHGHGPIRWELKHTSLLTKEEQDQRRWGTGFEKAPEGHEFE